jgi:hypothetical protein
MKTVIIILALTTTVHAGDDDRERDRTRGGYAYSRETYSDTHTRDSDEWTTDTRPHTVPEPSSPFTMLAAAAAALIGRRHRKGCIRERRVDVRTVRYP